MPTSARAQVHALLSLRNHDAQARKGLPPDPHLFARARQLALPPSEALHVLPDRETDSSWHTRAAEVLDRYGVVVLDGLLERQLCDDLLRQIETWPANAEGTSATTRQPHRRRHQALPLLRNASGLAAQTLFARLRKVFRATFGNDQATLVECGFLTSSPGAQAQALHADTAPSSMQSCEPIAIKVQLALVDVTEDMGPLEVVPGTHKTNVFGSMIDSMPGTASPPVLALPLRVRPGDATLYYSSLQHRGGANRGHRSRPTFHIAVVGGDGEFGAPTGMPYTVLVADIIEMYS